MKLKITAIGEPKDVQTKFGLKQKSYIKAQEHGDKYLSYWLSSSTRDWRVGDEIEVVEVASREYNGKTYYDVIMPKTSGGLPPEVAKSIEELKSDMTRVKLAIATLEKKVFPPTITGTDIPYPENTLDEPPF